MSYICLNCNHELCEYEINNLFCVECNSRFKSKDEIDTEIREKKRLEEISKQEYALSTSDLYEYKVVTVENERGGLVDKESMMDMLNSYAREGWKLHTVYSNELGKSAVSVLGFGVNATVCQDVFILERRVKK